MFSDTFIKNLAGYRSYHLNPHNQITHFIGIPMIVISIIWIASWAHPLIWYGLFGFSPWALMDLTIGAILLLVFAPFLYWGQTWFQGLGIGMASAIFWALFILGWIFQLVGHVFEGRRPALVDNLFQGILGPMFLVYEAFVHLGLRQPLQTKVKGELDKLLPAQAKAN